MVHGGRRGGPGADAAGGAAGRAGFVARGVLCVLVGAPALQVAFGAGGEEADREGALRQVAEQPFGRFLVGAIGCALIATGVVLAVRAAQRRFLEKLHIATMSRRARSAVSGLGAGGGVARGAVYAAAGVFILVAAVRFDPSEAKGVDATLRSSRTRRWARGCRQPSRAGGSSSGVLLRLGALVAGYDCLDLSVAATRLTWTPA